MLLNLLALIALPPLVALILAQLVPVVTPVVASFVFKWINKGTALLDAWGVWSKRLAFAVLNTLLVLGLSALGLADVSGDVHSWTQGTVEGILGAIAAMLLYDNGKARPAA
jgi:hypothetical protein